MIISRSILIKTGVILTFVLLIFISLYFLSNNKVLSNNYYAYSDNVVIEEDVLGEIIKEEITENPIVYDNMTLEELSFKLEKSLNDNLSGYGNFIASYALKKGVDPYLATAIMLHETGCLWGCSNLVKNCNNVGGMKGNGCGEYGYFQSLEEGIERFIDNIFNNYYIYGLNTADLMGSKYAEDPLWSDKVNGHIEEIKNR